MAPLRVLVVDDSLTVRKRIAGALSIDPQIEVVGEAATGEEAIQLCEALRPSVVTLDIVLPGMSGLAVTEHIMAFCPTPILVVSAAQNRGELFDAYDALRAGAVEVLEKPTGVEADASWETSLVQMVKLVARIKVITHPRARLRALTNGGVEPRREFGDPGGTPVATDGSPCVIVALGGSTGAPGAVVEILRALPPELDVPVLLCLHLGEAFAPAFGEWLDGLLPRPVAFARHGESIGAMRGRVVLASPGRHLTVTRGRVELHDAPARHSCRPSVDLLFESVAAAYGPAALGCLLTGMGRDGAAGLLAIRQAGGVTIAQDEATSVVYGMPREAVLLGAAQHVLPLGQIASALVRLSRREVKP